MTKKQQILTFEKLESAKVSKYFFSMTKRDGSTNEHLIHQRFVFFDRSVLRPSPQNCICH